MGEHAGIVARLAEGCAQSAAVLVVLAGLTTAAVADETAIYSVTLASDKASTYEAADTLNSTSLYTNYIARTVPGLGPGQKDTNDSTDLSGDLRYAIQQANATGGEVKIVFDTAAMISNGSCAALPCTITLANPLPPIASTYNGGYYSPDNGAWTNSAQTAELNLTIDGGRYGDVAIDGAGAYRIFFIYSGTVELKNLILQNAYAQGGSSGSGGGGLGAGAGIFVYSESPGQTRVSLDTVYFNNMTVEGGSSGVSGGANGGGGMGGVLVTDGSGGGFWLNANSGRWVCTGGASCFWSTSPSVTYTGGDMASGSPPQNGYGLFGFGGTGGTGTNSSGGWGGGGGGDLVAGGLGGWGAGGGSGGVTAGGGGWGGGGASGYNGAGGGWGGGGGSTYGEGVLLDPVGTPGGTYGGSSSDSGGAGGGGAALGPAVFVYQGDLTTINSGYGGTMSATGGSGANPGTGISTPVFQYRATVNGVLSASHGAVSSALCPAGTAASYSLSIPSTTLTAAIPSTLTVTALDSQSNSLSGDFVGTANTYTLTSSDNDTGLGGANGQSFVFNSCGTGTASIALNKAANADTTPSSVTLTATGHTDAAESSAITGTLSGITVSAGPMSQFAVTGSESATPGSPYSATITPEDASGNTVTYKGPVTLTSSDAFATLPVLSSIGEYPATVQVTLETPGMQTITAASGVMTGTSSGIAVSSLTAPSVTAEFSPESVFSGGSVTLTVTVTNPHDVTLNGVAFSNRYPNSFTADGVWTTCNPYTTLEGTSSGFTLAGLTLKPGGSCAFRATLAAPHSVGSYTDVPDGAISLQSGAETGTVVAATLTVVKPAPTISISSLPSSGVYGGSSSLFISYSGDGAVSLAGTSGICSVAGEGTSYTVNYVGAGICTLTPSATEGTNYAAIVGAAQSFTIRQAAQTINFASLPEGSVVTFGAPSVPLGATATSGLAVGFTARGACAVSDTTILNFVSAGTCTVTADQAGNNNYLPAPSAIHTITVDKATPILSWATPAPITYGTALSAAQLNATANVGGAFVYSPAAGTVLGIGTQTLTVTFTPANPSDYTTAMATVSLSVNAFTVPAPTLSGISSYTATAGSAGFTLTLTGTNFTSDATVYWGSTALTTTCTSATALTAAVPASLIASAGVNSLAVKTSAGTSNTISFAVSSPGTVDFPTLSTASMTVSAGETASYTVTMPASISSVTLVCLNLPASSSCSYSSGKITITTSSATPLGTHIVTFVFTVTTTSSTAWMGLPILLLPLALARKRQCKQGAWIFGWMAVVALAGLMVVNGCGAGSTQKSIATTPSQSVYAVSGTLIVK